VKKSTQRGAGQRRKILQRGELSSRTADAHTCAMSSSAVEIPEGQCNCGPEGGQMSEAMWAWRLSSLIRRNAAGLGCAESTIASSRSRMASRTRMT
jgi:hypothetical protein